MLKGIIDLHIHTNPDTRRRRLDDIEVARLAQEVGARGIVLKGHFLPTMDRAEIVRSVVPGLEVWGGIVLNQTVGGLNPRAVEVALALDAKIIWLPTLEASNHRAREGKTGGVVSVRDGKIVPELQAILKMVAQAGVVLATGHLSPEEIFLVVEAATSAGVKKILINHPEHFITPLSIEQQRQLTQMGPVWLERCYAQPAGGGGYQLNFETNLRAIEALGPQTTIVSTDVGQVENPRWDEALTAYLRFLRDHGVSLADLDIMTKDNPAFMLGLAPVPGPQKAVAVRA